MSRTHLRIDPIDLPLESPSVDFFELGGGLEGDDEEEYPATMDPDVLASLVIQLRTNLSSAQKERDELSKGFYASQGRLKDLQGADDRASALAKELSAAKAKHQEDEEAISMLRTKVEESRRGLMRLQTESRRMSGMQQLHSAGPLNLNFADGPPRTPVLPTSKASKRSSLYIPSTGGLAGMSAPPSATTNGRPNGHRRISSLSDPGNETAASFIDKSGGQVLTMPQDLNGGPPSAAIRRFSLLTTPRESLLNPQGAEIESLRNELHAVRVELLRAQSELKSAEESKIASDVMVKALREFIAETPVGASAHASEDGMSENGYAASMRGISLPPLPTDNIDDDDDDAPPEKSGFFSKLWKSSPAPSPARTSPPPMAARIKGHTPSETGSISSFVASWTKSVPTADQMSPPLNGRHQKGPSPVATSPKYAHSIAETTGTYSTATSLSEPNSPEAGAKTSVVVVVNGDEEREIHGGNDKLVDGNRTPTTGDHSYGVRMG